jgi:Leu/Phe-tRNA-protein transferase
VEVKNRDQLNHKTHTFVSFQLMQQNHLKVLGSHRVQKASFKEETPENWLASPPPLTKAQLHSWKTNLFK